MKKLFILLIAVGAVLVGFLLRSGAGSDGNELAMVDDVRGSAVKIASVRDLSTTEAPLPLLGSVKSEIEVTLRAESQGELIGVYTSLGSFVPAGTVVAEIKNSVQRAAVAQASAAVDAVRANLSKLKTGARNEELSISELNLANARRSLEETKTASVNTLRSVFTLAQDALTSGTDLLFSSPRSDEPRLLFFSFRRDAIEFDRESLETFFGIWSNSVDALTVESDFDQAFNDAEEHITFLNNLIDLLGPEVALLTANSNISQAQIDSFRAALARARGSVNSARAQISGARDLLETKVFAFEVAQQQTDQTTTGARSEDLLVAEAGLRQAEAGLAVAQANLETTLVRTPIGGVVSVLSVERGDFVNFFDSIALISNASALEVVTFITEDDRNSIRVGADALVDGRLNGVVTSVARALDNRTKKIEVKVAVTDSRDTLVSGQSVSLDITRRVNGTTAIDTFIIPISALKIGVQGSEVFTVDEERKLVAHPVVQGAIIDERIIILSGLTLEMEIVLDVRGLKEGDVVSIAR
jgi:RND family efflux transporter MFP subunit